MACWNIDVCCILTMNKFVNKMQHGQGFEYSLHYFRLYIGAVIWDGKLSPPNPKVRVREVAWFYI